MKSAAQLVADTWEWTLRTSPDPFRGDNFFNEPFGLPRKTYREVLDEQPINYYGELIPRIETVRRNLLRLGRAKVRPTIPM
jgi:hypothetical protein